MKRVLLTGASGFIGRHCIEPLRAAGYDVHAVSSRPRQDRGDVVTWHRADLLDPGQIPDLLARSRPSHLLHLAWFVVPGQLLESVDNYRWVQASLELVRRFHERGGERLLVAGSGYEYDWSDGHCSEAGTATAPSTFYGSCKHALGRLVGGYARQVGLSEVWQRIFFVYGPHEHPRRLVASVTRSLLRGEPARCSHGRQIRDYLYVQDVADALVRLLDSPIQGPVNVGSGQGIALAEIVRSIGRKVGRPELIELGALPARPNDVPLVVADTARIASELDWRPAHDLERGLDRTISWWREQQMNDAEVAT